jgi:hypothetical protein
MASNHGRPRGRGGVHSASTSSSSMMMTYGIASALLRFLRCFLKKSHYANHHLARLFGLSSAEAYKIVNNQI